MTQDDIISSALKRDNLLLQTIRHNFPHIPSNDDDIWKVFLNFANAVYASGAAAEREECAKRLENDGWKVGAALIRARGKK